MLLELFCASNPQFFSGARSDLRALDHRVSVAGCSRAAGAAAARCPRGCRSSCSNHIPAPSCSPVPFTRCSCSNLTLQALLPSDHQLCQLAQHGSQLPAQPPIELILLLIVKFLFFYLVHFVVDIRTKALPCLAEIR